MADRMAAFLLGLDVGTSVIKAALFDRDGREVAAASLRTSPIAAAPGWSELDPEATWISVGDLCLTVLRNAGAEGKDVAAVGVTGAMVGAWLVDAAGRALRPAILWNDTRAQTLMDEFLADRPDLLSTIFAHSGSVMQLGCTLPVLAWLARHEPDTLARARAVLTGKDFERFRLTGVIGTDDTEAAMAPGSAVDRDFAPALIPLFQLQPHGHLLPPCPVRTSWPAWSRPPPRRSQAFTPERRWLWARATPPLA